jgi:hypothetical protein
VAELLAQRIYGLALGYEDLNDHEELRRDPLLAVCVGFYVPFEIASILSYVCRDPLGAKSVSEVSAPH